MLGLCQVASSLHLQKPWAWDPGNGGAPRYIVLLGQLAEVILADFRSSTCQPMVSDQSNSFLPEASSWRNLSHRAPRSRKHNMIFDTPARVRTGSHPKRAANPTCHPGQNGTKLEL